MNAEQRDVDRIHHGAGCVLDVGIEKKRPKRARSDRFSSTAYWVLRPDLHISAFDRYLRKVICSDELARRWLNDIIEENLANRIVAISRLSIVEDSEERCVKLIVKDRVTCLSHRATKTCSIADDLEAGDFKLGVVFGIK